MDKRYFYLLKGKDKKGKTVFVQQLSSPSANFAPTLTYRAEYAKRCQTFKEIKEYKEQVKKLGNEISKMDLLIVKYLMDSENLSWSPPKDYVFQEYEDLLKGKGYE